MISPIVFLHNIRIDPSINRAEQIIIKFITPSEGMMISSVDVEYMLVSNLEKSNSSVRFFKTTILINDSIIEIIEIDIIPPPNPSTLLWLGIFCCSVVSIKK